MNKAELLISFKCYPTESIKLIIKDKKEEHIFYM
jgi:hypothetical protein